MRFRCPYCGADLGAAPVALCPSCGKGMQIPDHLRAVPFRERQLARRRRQRQAERERRRRGANELPALGRRPVAALAALAVLAVLGSLLVARVRRGPAPSAPLLIGRAQEELNILRVALDDFRNDCGAYPDERSGLYALISNPGQPAWRGPYVTLIKPDPWRRPYVYEQRGGEPLVLCLGPDGQRGTSDDLRPRGWQALVRAGAETGAD